MRMCISTDILLKEPDADNGFITWFDIDMFDDGDGDEKNRMRLGRAHAARIHASHAYDCNASIDDALDADSAEMVALYEVFFKDGWLKDDFSEGSGADLLYVCEVKVKPAFERRNIDFAVVRRLCDTLGQGAALAVMPYDSAEEITRWAQLGFEVATPGMDFGFIYLRLTHRTARVGDPDRPGHFKVLPNPSPDQDDTHH